jgi:zinc protease
VKATEYFSNVMSLDAGRVQRAVVRYLDPDEATLLVYCPGDQPVFKDQSEDMQARLNSARARYVASPTTVPDAHAAPSRAPRVTLERRVGAVSVFRAASGLPILVRRRPGAPIVHSGLYLAGGAAAEPPALEGISTVMMRSSLKGTHLRSAEDIAGESEMLGGSIGTSVSSDGGGWTLSVPVSRYRDAVSLLQDVVQHPRFDEAAVHTERAIALTQLAQLRDDMMRYPIRLATDAAYAGHPYGRALLGTDDTLNALTADDVRHWHEASVLASTAVGAVVGDGNEEELAQAFADEFAGIRLKGTVAPVTPAWPASLTQRVEFRHKAQSAMAIAFPGPVRRDPQRFTVSILSGIASGLGGRFFEELREKRSLAYTVQAWATERVSAGMFTAYIATDPRREDEARAALLAECARLRDEPVRAEELERAARYVVGSHAIALQSGSVVLGELLDAWLFGDGLEELGEFESRVAAVTATAIQEWANGALDPERRVEGVVRGTQARVIADPPADILTRY